MFLIILGVLFVFYDFFLICISPGTFMDNLTSFTHIWTVAGSYMILEGIYKRKKGKYFFTTWKKWLKYISVGLVCSGFVISIVNLCFILSPKTSTIDETADYVVLLGGGIDKNGKLPESVQRRVEKAAEYLNIHKQTVCVVTGGTLKWLPYSEAPAIKDCLVSKGIESDRILVEDQALDTIQNFQYTCEKLSEYFGISRQDVLNKKMMIVTNHFHMRRAERLAGRMGFTDYSGLTTGIPIYNIPHTYLREICAYVKLNLRILITGEPEIIKT